jgi:alkylhydroperoxidase/carboxymuconolactone decarboxylase family protein YurZ
MDLDAEQMDDEPASLPPNWETCGADGSEANPLTARDTSLLNIAVAATQNRSGDLPAQFMLALTNGVTLQEITAILDQVSLYTGRRADDQITILGEVLREHGTTCDRLLE